MKKVVKLISLFILLLIINVGVVRAANKCGNVTISTIRPKSNDDKLDYQLGSNNIFQYKFKIQSSTEVTATTATAYCHNPGILAVQQWVVQVCYLMKVVIIHFMIMCLVLV